MGLGPLCRGALFGFVLLLGLGAWAKDRVGIFTGTFDPFHLGHRRVIEIALDHADLDYVYVIPNLDSPHKPKALGYHLRRKLTEVSLAGLDAAKLPDQELEEAMRAERVEGLIKRLRQRHVDSEIYQVMGDDAIERYAQGILSTVEQGLGLLLNFRQELPHSADPRQIPHDQLDLLTHPRVVHLPFLGVNPSSTEIRAAFSSGTLHPMLHPKAALLIIQMGLYGADQERFCEKSLMAIAEEAT